jgi:phage baseplate assembly protein gpV
MHGDPPDTHEREHRAKRFGFVPAIVTNNKHPDGHYRVKVRYPFLSNGTETGGEESNWARIASFGAGKDRGGYFLPEVGDEVMVAFEQGDFARPIVIGSLWNKESTPIYDNKDGKNNKRGYKSRAGHVMEFDDTENATKITFKTKAGSTIFFDDKAETVSIHDGANENSFLLDMKNKSITLESKTGDVVIKTKEKLKLDCKTLETKAGDKHVMSAGAKYDVSAKSNFAINGKTGFVEASSELTLKGNLVDINPPGGSASPQGGGGTGASSQGGGGSSTANSASGSGGSSEATASGNAGGAGGGGSAAEEQQQKAQQETTEEYQIEVQLVNALGEPQANVRYELRLPDGTVKTGTSGPDGWIRISGLKQTGDATLVLPDIDEATKDKGGDLE